MIDCQDEMEYFEPTTLWAVINDAFGEGTDGECGCKDIERINRIERAVRQFYQEEENQCESSVGLLDISQDGLVESLAAAIADKLKTTTKLCENTQGEQKASPLDGKWEILEHIPTFFEVDSESDKVVAVCPGKHYAYDMVRIMRAGSKECGITSVFYVREAKND